MNPPDLDNLLGRARQLSREYQAGGAHAFPAFVQLLEFLLNLTVMAPGGGLQLSRGPRPNIAAIRGRMAGGVVPLHDGRFLKIALSVFIDTSDRDKLKVERSIFQYQCNQSEDDDRWIVRYEYERRPPGPHPTMHLHVRATLLEGDVLPKDKPLERIHFPTYRVTVEAMIRMLIDQFGVESDSPPEVWRPILEATERAFFEIARTSPLPRT